MNWRNALIMVFFAFLAASCAKAPNLNISPTSIELGILSPGEVAEDTVWVKNTGGGFLKVDARSGCDCIELENTLPDSIPAGDSAALAFVYYAPDSVKTDRKSILLSANDEKNKTAKIEITAAICKRRLQRDDSTLTFLPIYASDNSLQAVSKKVFEEFYAKAPTVLKMKLVNPTQIAQDVMTDHQYTRRPLEEVIRKWALMDSIRWVIACQVSTKDTQIILNCALVDGFSEFPFPLNMTCNSLNASNEFLTEVYKLFQDYNGRKKEALMQGMQRKWVIQRKDIIGKPLPKLQLIDVIKGDTLSADSVYGKVLVMHFFSIDCEHCEEEAEWMRKLDETHPKNLVVWGVSIDVGEIEKVKKFAEEHKASYPIVLPTHETNRRLTRIYGGATPQTVVAGKDGKIAEFFVGFNDPLIKRLEGTLKALGATE